MILKKRYILIVALIAVLMLIEAAPAMAQRISTTAQVIDCGQVLFRKPVTVHFELLNEGVGTVNIKSVDTSCGCTEVNYPKGVISANKPFVVSATYDAKLMGHFEKYIDIYTSGASLPFTLTMRGVVVEEIHDYEGEYPFMIGKIKADRNEVMFDDVRKGENPVEEIHILNTTGDIVTPVIMHLPEYMRADVSPSSIPPGRSGVVYLTLDSKRMGDYGLKQASVYLGLKAGEKVSADKEIDVSAILIPSFGVVTDQQLLYSPKVKLSDTVLDLGSFEGKKKKKGTIVIENLGRTDLEISNLQLFTPGLTIDLSATVIPPGESAKLKVTAEKKSLKDVRKQPRILMITNDPRNPKVMVDVNIK